MSGRNWRLVTRCTAPRCWVLLIPELVAGVAMSNVDDVAVRRKLHGEIQIPGVEPQDAAARSGGPFRVQKASRCCRPGTCLEAANKFGVVMGSVGLLGNLIATRAPPAPSKKRGASGSHRPPLGLFLALSRVGLHRSPLPLAGRVDTRQMLCHHVTQPPNLVAIAFRAYAIRSIVARVPPLRSRREVRHGKMSSRESILRSF